MFNNLDVQKGSGWASNDIPFSFADILHLIIILCNTITILITWWIIKILHLQFCILSFTKCFFNSCLRPSLRICHKLTSNCTCALWNPYVVICQLLSQVAWVWKLKWKQVREKKSMVCDLFTLQEYASLVHVNLQT